VCVDSSSTSLDQDLRCAARSRARPAPVAILGSQVTYTPGEIFQHDNVDVVVARRARVHRARDRRARRGEARSRASGTSWKRGGRRGARAEREKIAQLDALPLAARHLLDNQSTVSPGSTGR
jgi:hypothetical protein